MQQLTQHADRILLHAYRTSNIDVYQYTQSRIYDIASANKAVQVMPIFQVNQILWDHGSQQIRSLFTFFRPMMPCLNRNQLPSNKTSVCKDINGFLYSLMPKSSLCQCFNQQQWTTKFLFRWKCHTYCKYRFILFVEPGGQTTNSIVVNSSGNYSVTVTGASGNSATSPAVAVSVTNSDRCQQYLPVAWLRFVSEAM